MMALMIYWGIGYVSKCSSVCRGSGRLPVPGFESGANPEEPRSLDGLQEPLPDVQDRQIDVSRNFFLVSTKVQV